MLSKPIFHFFKCKALFLLFVLSMHFVVINHKFSVDIGFATSTAKKSTWFSYKMRPIYGLRRFNDVGPRSLGQIFFQISIGILYENVLENSHEKP